MISRKTLLIQNHLNLCKTIQEVITLCSSQLQYWILENLHNSCSREAHFDHQVLLVSNRLKSLNKKKIVTHLDQSVKTVMMKEKLKLERINNRSFKVWMESFRKANSWNLKTTESKASHPRPLPPLKILSQIKVVCLLLRARCQC